MSEAGDQHVNGNPSNVQVTLQILTSIIEKAPRDLALYAGSVLAILNTVLGSKDINMVEESIPTFESYCKYVDAASLNADQSRTKQYKSLVQQYTAFGSLELSTTQNSVPQSTKRRTIALKAIRAIVGSEALVVDTSDQLNAVMPVILENLDLEKGGSFAPLQHRATTGEQQSADSARKRRMSSAATVASIDEVSADPATASETTADADKLAEEEVRVLAIRCLKQIFSISTGTSRTQMRLATSLVLRYIATKERPKPPTRSGSTASFATDWATTLFETIARWTPVQDRFIIVITTVETLVRSPIVEAILEKQLILATLIDWLLKSDINLIGLSVMDVLLRLIQHTLLLLQLGSREQDGSVSKSPKGDSLGLYKEMAQQFDPTAILTEPERARLPDEKATTVSPMRRELLLMLERCISDLATHIYYTDQISDMLTAIMARLKPSSASDIPTAAAAVNDPVAATKTIADSANFVEDPSTDGFFSFATARVVALKAVKDIILTSNNKRTGAGASAEVRSRVGVQVWEGTQWLLKDEDPEVRQAYIDALITWLRLETNKGDSMLAQDGLRKPRSAKRDGHANGDLSVAKRAVSNASRRGEKQTKSTFLQLLHLAIYDEAAERAEDESTILLLYMLMWVLVERLGVNAIRTGVPMIMNLQGAVLNGNDHGPNAKARVAGLVHGYLWAIAEKFDFESTAIGHEINAEISRRKRSHCWSDQMRFPPSSIAHVLASSAAVNEKQMNISEEAVGTIRPFLNINVFVDEIATAYDRTLVSPPSSPPSSPGRIFSVPTLGFGYGYNAGPVHKPAPEHQIPQKVKDEMCGTWSRESCLASIDKESNPSLSGSRTAPSSTGRQHLAVNRSNGNGVGNTEADQAHALPVINGLGNLPRTRELSAASSFRDPDTSSRDSTMRVSDLKRALAGTGNDLRNPSPLRRPLSRSRQSSGSESLVSWNPADDDSLAEPGSPKTTTFTRPTTAIKTDNENATFHDQATVATHTKLDDDIPPVPKIPSALNLPGTWPSRDTSPMRPPQSKLSVTSSPVDVQQPSTVLPRPDTAATSKVPHSERSRKRTSRPASRAGAESVWSHTTTGRKTDLSQLLASINVEPSTTAPDNKWTSGTGNDSKTFKPPY